MEPYDIAFFGYGSLVNPETLRAGAVPIPTFVKGWIRQWKNCADTQEYGKICALSVERRSGSDIKGVLVRDQKSQIYLVDQREEGYERVQIELPDTEINKLIGNAESYIYVSTGAYKRWGSDDYPIFRSYLDCVLAGYYRWWQEDGVRHFVQTTEGWHVPILEDRRAPRYRQFTTTAALQKMFDHYVNEAVQKAKSTKTS